VCYVFYMTSRISLSTMCIHTYIHAHIYIHTYMLRGRKDVGQKIRFCPRWCTYIHSYKTHVHTYIHTYITHDTLQSRKNHGQRSEFLRLPEVWNHVYMYGCIRHFVYIRTYECMCVCAPTKEYICMCVYVCMHTQDEGTLACLHACMHMDIRIHMNTFLLYIYAYTYILIMHASIHAYINTYIHCIYTCIYSYNTYIHVYVHICIHSFRPTTTTSCAIPQLKKK
jgi:hypothetical protein